MISQTQKGEKCAGSHVERGTFGFQGTVGYSTAVDATKGWESEKKDYRGGVLPEANAMPVGHYTQMVWRGTRSVGCGEAICNKTLILHEVPRAMLGFGRRENNADQLRRL